MLLRNDKLKPITVIHLGKKTIVYPKQTIEGPIQLSIFGLTVVTENKPTSYLRPFATPAPDGNSIYNSENIKEIDKAIEYINEYTAKPSVGICILTKNSLNLISDCLQSIETHVKYENTKVYIFDTGTTDQNVLNYYQKVLSSYKFPIEVVNVGEYHFSKNYNKGLDYISTDYYLIQNNDTVAVNDYVTRLMKIAILDKIGACGPRMLYKDGTIQHDGQLLYNHKDKGFAAPTHVNLRHNVRDVAAGILPADGITCAGMLVKANIYWEAGGLNEIYHDIFQDVELNIKIRMLGKAIYCDRDSIIYHYDNTSRNAMWANDHRKLKLKHADHSYLFGKYSNELRYYERPAKKYSIVTLVNDKKQYIDFLNDLKNQDIGAPIEIIALPNFNNEYSSAAEALNVGLSVSEGDYVIMCHQDLRVPNNWLDNINSNIKLLASNDIKFGVLGMAGSWAGPNFTDGGVIYLDGEKNHRNPYTEVQCLDELCLIVKNNENIRFDATTFNNYHCYGPDLCLQYINKGYKNYAINAPCTHLSDGFKNLKSKEGLIDFVDSSIKLFKKWRGHIPYFRTLTARFSAPENGIHFFVAKELNKNGLVLKEKFILPD